MNEPIMSEVNREQFNKLQPWQTMISSCSGAFLTSIIVTPFDVVKIRIQAQQKEFLRNKCFLYCNGLMEHICYCNGDGTTVIADSASKKWFKRPIYFRGTLDGLFQIARAEGLSSLWSGLPPTLIMAIPSTVIYFTCYDQLRYSIQTMAPSQKDRLWVPMLSGAIARLFAAITISPLEMVRTKMQSEKLTYHDIGRAVRSLVKQQGYSALYRGLVPTLLRDVPFSSLYWAIYETAKVRFQTEEQSFLISFLCGGAAGSVAATLTLPFDVVKTHRQIELGKDLLPTGRGGIVKTNPSTLKALRNIYATRGLSGMFAGIIPRLIKVAPACAIMISTYEAGKKFFAHFN